MSGGGPSGRALENRQQYEYRPLPHGDYIRRLILEPGTGDDALVGRLEIIELTNAHILYPFHAISYVWGTRDPDQIMIIDGRPKSITASLRDALRQTRFAYRPTALWADAICMDQGDDQEKGHQVALMGRIYQTSICTLICLGVHAMDQGHARNVAALIADVEKMLDRVFQNPEFSWNWDEFPHPQADDPLLKDDRWNSWRKLVNRPWFYRGWVVQEAALGPRGAVLWAGVQIRWLSVLRVHQWLVSRAAHLMPTLTYWQISELLSRTYALQQSTETKTYCPEHNAMKTKPLHLLHILHSARSLNVSDPKDRIFAFMALPTFDKAMPALQPDYRKEVSYLDVYQDFAIQYLEKTGNLDILSCVEHEREEEEDEGTRSFPSWVPRWDRRRAVFGWFNPIHRKIHSDDALKMGILTGKTTLRVRAIVFDSVKYVSDKIEPQFQATEAVEEVVSLWRGVAQQSSKYQSPYKHRTELAFLTAVYRGEYLGNGEEWVRSIKAFAQLLKSDYPSCPMDIYNGDRDAQRISKFVSDISGNRRFVLLGRGYYGVASESTREGDVCAIIFGTRLPCILREVAGNDGHYTVVGSAVIPSKVYDDGFFPGLGYDERYEDWTEWGLPTKDIFLC